jgi:SAM-dependent methyltransferase
MWSLGSGIPWHEYRKNAKNHQLWDEWANLLARYGRNWLVPSVNMGIERFFDAELSGGRNLDLCCGSHPHVKGSVGLDASVFALVRLKESSARYERPYSGLVNFDLNCLEEASLPFKDASFSSATMICGWNYINPIDRLIEEVDRVVIPGGPLYIVQFGSCVEESMAVRRDDVLNIKNKFSELDYSPQSMDVHGDDVWAVKVNTE